MRTTALLDRLSSHTSGSRARATSWPALLLQAGAVAVLAFLLYAGLRSELPIDDVLRFTPAIAAGVYEWDASHLLMQPAAVLWHRYLGFGGTARASQESLNAFCAAVSLAILYLLLLRMGVEPLRRAALTALAALSFNLLCLATSGHIKLAVLPFLAGSLYQALLWEREVRAGGPPRDGRLAASGLCLGLASAFLVNSILVAPLLAVAVAAVSLRAGAGRSMAVRRALGVALPAAGTFFVLLSAAYRWAVPGASGLGGFVRLLLDRGEKWPESGGLAVSLSRGVFGVVQNFVYAGDFGAMARTWMSGDAEALAPARGMLLGLAALFLAAAVLLAWVYGEALLLLLRGRGPAVPWAFLAGALAFAVAWNLNEADFYFQITFPTVALMAAAPASTRRGLGEPALLVLVALTVLLGWAVPRRSYPLERYNAELRERLAPGDLTVLWGHWSGGPSLLFMDLRGIERLFPDKLLYTAKDHPAAFRRMERTIDRRLAAGGRVYLFEILDERTWNAPWPTLRRRGITPERMERFFRDRWQVVDRGRPAEIRCWELRKGEGV